MDHVGFRVMEHDKAILSIDYLADRVVNELEKFVKVRRCDNALDDLEDELPFFFSLTLPATVFRRVQFPLDSGDNPHKIVFLQIIVCPGKHCLDSDLLTDGSGNNNKRNV